MAPATTHFPQICRLGGIFPLLWSVTALAGSDCAVVPHTMHTISTNKKVTCVLAKLYEPERYCLVDANGQEIGGKSFEVVPGTDQKFGMSLRSGATFDMEYALTCVASDSDGSGNAAKVIFDIGASGPAIPEISIVNLNGAEGTWKSTGGGENYFLNF